MPTDRKGTNTTSPAGRCDHTPSSSGFDQSAARAASARSADSPGSAAGSAACQFWIIVGPDGLARDNRGRKRAIQISSLAI